MSRKKKNVGRRLSVILLFFLVGGLGVWYLWTWATKPFASTGNFESITITSGTTVNQLAGNLQQRQLIRSAWIFRFLVRTQHDDFKMYAGDYQLAPMMTPEEIINDLLKGPQFAENNRVTIPEGYSTEQIIELLVQKGIGSKEDFEKVIMEDTFPYSFINNDAAMGIHRLEGYLFPNTYAIDKEKSPHAVIDMFLQQFSKELTPEVQTQLDSMNLSIQQWVTLGSLVEKEAEKETDRPLIASVFLNRLKINQPLQSCATIQFLLGTPKAKLYAKDLIIPSLYNTYIHKGLPPGPIANPGHASLQAVLYSTQADYLYFVAKKDGFHAFSTTYEEHLQNIKLNQ